MFVAFNINETENIMSMLNNSVSIDNYRLEGKKIFEKDKVSIKTTIEKYYFETENTILDGNYIMKEWFPLVEGEVFISHSHADKEDVYILVGFLYVEFGIKSFVDSSVWGYADDLIKMIDDKHCLDKNIGVYNYKKRNITTSNVYLMLLNSLQNMIDYTECVIFIQTPNSVKKINEQFEDSTYSPWIFSELNMVEKIRKKPLIRNYELDVNLNFEKKAKMDDTLLENVQIAYSISDQLSNIKNLSYEDLLKWKNNKVNNPSAAKNLDRLYLLKGVFDYE